MSSYQTTVVGVIVSTLLIYILLLTSAPYVCSQSMTVHNVIIIIQMDLRIIDFVHILNYVSLHQPYFSFFCASAEREASSAEIEFGAY